MSQARRTGLLVCGLASLLAHAALLGWGVQPGVSPRRADAPVGLRPVQVSAPRLPSDVPPEDPASEPLILADRSEVIVHLPVQEPMGPLQAPMPEALVAAGDDTSTVDLVRLPAGRPELFDDDGYVPRPQLSVVPVAQQTLILEWPEEGAPPAGRYRGVVSLFIDEQGVIQHVRFDDDGLPESLKDQARSALATIRYSPGKVKDQIVKSRLRLELVFEADPRMVTRGSRR